MTSFFMLFTQLKYIMPLQYTQLASLFNLFNNFIVNDRVVLLIDMKFINSIITYFEQMYFILPFYFIRCLVVMFIFAVFVSINTRAINLVKIYEEVTLGACIFLVIIMLFFNRSWGVLQFVTAGATPLSTYPSTFANNLTFGMDGVSLLFLALTFLVFPLCFSSWRQDAAATPGSAVIVFKLFFLMEVLLVLTFTCTDLLFFYVSFEALLIPMFILIGTWGGRERRIKAAYYFFLYTLFGSLLMLLGVLLYIAKTGTSDFWVLLNTKLSSLVEHVVWLCFFMAFAVKLPLFPFHIWLPEAHVEAPTVGSMLLASLLLKLGGYGFLRFLVPAMPQATESFSTAALMLASLGVIFGSLNTIVQTDLKRIVAYSSVAHMNFAVLGVFSGTQIGIDGAIYLMLAHGIVSAGLFFAVGVLYSRYHTRLVQYYNGLNLFMPVFGTLMLAILLANMGFPGTPNFSSEILILAGLSATNYFLLLVGASSLVFAAIYTIWLYNRLFHGAIFSRWFIFFLDVNKYEATALILFIIQIALLGVNSTLLLSFVWAVFESDYELFLLPYWLRSAHNAVAVRRRYSNFAQSNRILYAKRLLINFNQAFAALRTSNHRLNRQLWFSRSVHYDLHFSLISGAVLYATAYILLRHPFVRLNQLVDIVATDRLSYTSRFSIKYLFLAPHLNHRVILSLNVASTTRVPSLTSLTARFSGRARSTLFASSVWLEREVSDMFGLRFARHVDDRRLLTDYGFTGYPLRKDFPLTGFTEVFYGTREGRLVYSFVELAQELRVVSV